MKRLNLVVNIILAIAVVVLYILHFTSSKSGIITDKNSFNNNDTSYNDGSLSIAFINTDTIFKNYSFYLDATNDMEAEKNKAEAQLERKMKDLESSYNSLMTMVEKNLITKEKAAENFGKKQEAVEKYRTTIIAGVPTIFMAFTNHPLLKEFDLSSVVGCGSGGAPLPVEAAKQFEAKTGSIIFECYGLSETAPLATANPSDKENRKFGSVGFPISNTDVKMLDMDTGTKELARGDDGEIAISGPQVMKEYWNKPEENKEVFRNIEDRRYFLTGDIGHIDDEGYIVITDRKKDMIIVGGFNCYPREVEEVLYEHPKVALAAVVGIPHPRSGETVNAFVQLVPGATADEQEIIAFCRERLAGYKRPKTVEFRDTLPTSVVGKVLRRVLKDEVISKQKAGGVV